MQSSTIAAYCPQQLAFILLSDVFSVIIGYDSIVKCTGYKILGKSRKFLRISVDYKPHFECIISYYEGARKDCMILIWPQLYPEAIYYKLRVKDFGPLIVAMDSHGGNLYADVSAKVQERLLQIYRKHEIV
jgi:hypothetical protein